MLIAPLLRANASKQLLILLLWSIGSILFGVFVAVYSNSPLPFLLLLLILMTAVFVASDLAFYAMLVCWPFSFRYILPSQLEVQTPTEPLLGMLVFAFLMRQLLRRVLSTPEERQARPTFPFALPVLFYSFATFLPSINAPQMLGSLKGATRAVVYMMLSFVSFELVQRRRDLKHLFVATFPGAAVAVIWTTVVLIQHLDRWQWTSAYQGSPFTNYSAYGGFTATFLLILLSRQLIDRSKYDRVMWATFLGIFGIGMLFCFSRGVWLAMLIAFGFVFMQLGHSDRHKKVLLVAGAAFLGLVILSVPGVYEQIWNRINTLFNFQFASNRSRLLRWGQALLMFLRHPIIGNGYGTFAELYEEDAGLVGEYTAQYQLGAHSEYLQVLAEQGIVGFAAWACVIVVFFRYGFRALAQIEDGFYRSLIVGLMAAELAMLIFCAVFTFPDGDELTIPFWLIYGLLPAVVHIARDVQEPEFSSGGEHAQG